MLFGGVDLDICSVFSQARYVSIPGLICVYPMEDVQSSALPIQFVAMHRMGNRLLFFELFTIPSSIIF